MAAGDAASRGLAEGDWAEVYNDRGSFLARVSLAESVKPGVAVAPGIYWNKHAPGATNANATTSSALSDLGGGATFFDNLVEVRQAAVGPDQGKGLP
jgi:anaerobic selenocysteine-containing dehydrogenase